MSAASMRSSKLWLDAISQNAWDTGKYQLKCTIVLQYIVKVSDCAFG